MAPQPLQVLIVEDNPDDAMLLLAELARAGYDPTSARVETAEQFVAGLAMQPDIIVCDYSLPSMSAPDVLNILRDRKSDIPLIVVSGTMDEATCVTALRLGAVDYLLKDRLVRLGPAVADALTARRMAEIARTTEREGRKTADILRGVVDHAPAAICVRDATGTSLLTNAEYDRLRLPERSAHPSDGPVFGGTPTPDSANRCLTSIEQACLDGADNIQAEESFGLPGDERTYLVARYPVIDHTGHRFAVGTIYVDISPQKQVEAELRELDRIKGDLVATVSHELRTPLTNVFGYTEVLLDAVADPDQRRMVEVIDRNSRRLLSLVDDLLTLSVKSGDTTRPEGLVEVKDLITSITTVLAPTLAAAHIALDVHVPDDLPPLRGDRDGLERVLINLVSNAVKFSDDGSTVTLQARHVGSDLQLSVCDTGMGIPLDEQAQIFTRFFRTEEARRRVIQGTGLGLAVVREIVDRHGGNIDIESAPGQGTTMTLTLPTGRPGVRTG